VTLTRSGNTATVTNSSGVIVAVNANIPRFDYNPTTLVCRGLLIEESRTNALLNSLIDGTSLGTQVVTVTAAARTLSFYGTGQVVLSGAHSATVTGTGAYPTRTTLTFTPSAGVLTLTVSGTVQFAQLELGAFATSFIPTAASQVTRNADVATMTGTNFSSWYVQGAGSICVDFLGGMGSFPPMFTLDDSSGGNNNRIYMHRFAAASTAATRIAVSYSANPPNSTTLLPGVVSGNKCAIGYRSGSQTVYLDGANAATATVADVPNSQNRLSIGYNPPNNRYMNGTVRKIFYYPLCLTAAEIQAISK
jgi:hypothetical protein